MPRVVGYDANRVRRVYAEADDLNEAVLACEKEAAEYVKERPDTGPLYEWRFGDVPTE